MGKNKYLFVLWMLLAITLAGGIFTEIYLHIGENGGHNGKIRIATSFYPVYIAASNVVGSSDRVALENLSEPQTGCMHDYQLTPQDMIQLSKADLFLVNGGGIENFLAEVGRAYPRLAIRSATEGLSLLGETEEGHVHADGEVHGDGNAHSWMDTRLYAKMVQNIADYICEADPEHAETYQENAKAYCEGIESLTSQIEQIKEAVPSGANVVVFHEAFEYTIRQYGMHSVYCLNLDEERQVSAGEVAQVMGKVEEFQVPFTLAEELYGKDMGEAVERETGCKPYYLDTLVRGDGKADSYLASMQKNIDSMKQILEQEFGICVK